MTGLASVAAIRYTQVSSVIVVGKPAPMWAGGAVPSANGVSLPTGVHEEDPGPDIEARNPIGPSVSFDRMYRTQLAAMGYASPGLSPGWTHNYDLTLQAAAQTFTPSWVPLTLTYPNGATETWVPTLDGAGIPTGELLPQQDGTPRWRSLLGFRSAVYKCHRPMAIADGDA